MRLFRRMILSAAALAVLFFCRGAALAEEKTQEAAVFGTGLLEGIGYADPYTEGGFVVPLLQGKNEYCECVTAAEDGTGPSTTVSINRDGSSIVLRYAVIRNNGDFADDPEEAGNALEELAGALRADQPDTEFRTSEIAGFPALVFLNRAERQGGLVCIRHNYTLTGFAAGAGGETDCPLTLGDLEAIAAAVGFDETKAISREDAGVTLSSEGDVREVNVSGTLQLHAAFRNPEAVEAFSPGARISFRAVLAEKDREAEFIRFSEDGLLTVKRPGKRLTRPVQVDIYAETPMDTKAKLSITVYPPVEKVRTAPAALTLYAGSGRSGTARAVFEPADNPVREVTWRLAGGKPLVTLKDNGDGSVTVTPLDTVGETACTAREPGGRKGTLKIYVVQAVESVELSVSGDPVPGGTVTVRAALSPKEAKNRNVEWSLDVDESVAAVSDKGVVSIGRETPPGTVITVTCMASGAAEPVSAAVKITVSGPNGE